MAVDHNSSRSNRESGAQDHNTTRSNRDGVKDDGGSGVGIGDGSAKSGAQDHNTTRSNRANIHGGGGGGSTQGLGSTLGVIKSGISLVSVIVLIAASADVYKMYDDHVTINLEDHITDATFQLTEDRNTIIGEIAFDIPKMGYLDKSIDVLINLKILESDPTTKDDFTFEYNLGSGEKTYDKFRLDNKVAIITGGTRGIGFAIASALGEAGAKLIVSSRTDKYNGFDNLKKSGFDVTYFKADITDPSSPQKLIDFTIKEKGRLDILVNHERVDAFSVIIHKSSSVSRGREIIEKLTKIIPRQQFEVALQAAIGGKIIARGNVRAYRKNVTAKLYGGDVTRKMKLLKKQKKGKKRMKQFGSVVIPQEAFLSMMKKQTSSIPKLVKDWMKNQ